MAASQVEGVIRPVTPEDHDALWAILEPVLCAGETLAVDRDISRVPGAFAAHPALGRVDRRVMHCFL